MQKQSSTHKSDLLDTLAVAFVLGVDTEALDSPEEDHAAAEEDNLVDIGLVGLPFDQVGALSSSSRQNIRLVKH